MIVAHACDLDVRVRLRHAVSEVPALRVGDRIVLPTGAVILRIETDESVPLPPVTIRNTVTIGVDPAGGLGAGQ